MQIIQESGSDDRLCEACNQDINQPRLEQEPSNIDISVSDGDVEGASDQSIVLFEPYYGKLLAPIKREDGKQLSRIRDDCIKERSQKRILKELRLLHEDTTLPYISIAPIDGALDNCLASMEGSPESVLAGGVFWLHVTFPVDYPMKPPTVRFITPVYHPNIDSYGRVCIDILESSWNPCLTIGSILLSILSVFHDPILGDPLVAEIANKYINDLPEYCMKVKQYTKLCAKAKRPNTSNLINMIL